MAHYQEISDPQRQREDLKSFQGVKWMLPILPKGLESNIMSDI